MLRLRSLLLEMFPGWFERREVRRRAADNKAVLDALKRLRQDSVEVDENSSEKAKSEP